MVKVSFIGYNNYKTSIPIAAACGIGNFAYSKYKSNKIFDELKLIAKKKFRVVSPENADILIYPHKLELKDKLSNIQNFASEKKIPFLLFRDDDNKKSANIKYGTVCRSSIFKKKSKKNEVLAYLREHLKFPIDYISILVDANLETKKIIYDNKEKLDYLREENADISNFMEILKLTIKE